MISFLTFTLLSVGCYASHYSYPQNHGFSSPKLVSQSVNFEDVPTKVIKITKTVAVKVPVPYPVKVPYHVPVPVPVNHPVPVPVPQIVKVPEHVPYQVSKHIPVELPQQVPFFITKTVSIPQPLPVPHPVKIVQPLPYPVSHPVPVSNNYQSNHESSDYNQVSTEGYQEQNESYSDTSHSEDKN
ncbi:cyclin-dependent kinase inhibitor 1C-like [Chelonus insularis]|uniref:cyclin-dependent kinase inhibitor 1C-like n=1 Tax=Chelonus insularis TaxID=460826 RepID=UPI00158F36D5|nr:cyclin-dependent kinase inhibitor 1C-like [Chelonus insularis]